MKKIFGIFVCMLLITIMFSATVIAGDEENPEIIDDENDTGGSPAIHLSKSSLKAIDILSAWFYENQNEPDYLFIAIKVVDLNYLLFLRSTYSVKWRYDVTTYEAKVRTQFQGLYFLATLERYYPKKINLISADFKKENNIVTLKIPKNLIGDPQPSDILTQTNAWTSITFGGFNLGLELAYDTAPNNQLHGKNYVIQY